jgi:S1-C subfamily serine protease
MRPRFAVAALSLLSLTATGTAVTVPVSAAETYWTESKNATTPPEIARLTELINGITEKLKPALVQVRVRRTVEDDAESDTPRRAPGAPEGRRAAGSGFIIRQDGYIVTNAHVVDEADRIQIRLGDARRFDARLIGIDNRVDLALLKIDAKDLPVAALGDSNKLLVGEFVLALGHPFGLAQTVSFGIVGRKGAPLFVASPGFDFIQTDAAVNPGNSGGPLVNMAGEVIGVNSMAALNGSIGFAIPVSLLPQLATKGRVEWSWLGVNIAEVSDEEAGKYGLADGRGGVLIRSVVAGQPADRGGVKPEDVVTSVDGTQIENVSDLQRIIASTPVGHTVKLQVMRNGKATELSVTVGPYQGPAARRPATPR